MTHPVHHHGSFWGWLHDFLTPPQPVPQTDRIEADDAVRSSAALLRKARYRWGRVNRVTREITEISGENHFVELFLEAWPKSDERHDR